MELTIWQFARIISDKLLHYQPSGKDIRIVDNLRVKLRRRFVTKKSIYCRDDAFTIDGHTIHMQNVSQEIIKRTQLVPHIQIL